MTDRLYYNDPFEREFDATVLRVESRGSQQAVWLDRSAFYPTSGGQPFDVGILGGSRVVDVVDEDGDVVHLVEGESLNVDQVVHGTIDWARRHDYMQQHSGQHVLSAAFIRTCGVRTVSVHLGADVSTLDLEREVTPAQIAAAEDAANQVIWEHRPVAIRYASDEEANTLGLRKPSARKGTLRLIDIEAWDLSACGGTHVSNTAGIGVAVVSQSERFRGGMRIEFRCGFRAVRSYRQLRDVVADAGVRLSVAPADVASAIDRLLQDSRDQKRTMSGVRAELARYQGESFVREAESVPGGTIVVRVADGDADSLKMMATSIAAQGLVAVLVSAGTPALVVAARALALPLSAQSIIAGLIKQYGGRGGGKPDLAQAGGLQGEPAEIAAHARQLIMSGLADRPASDAL